MKFTRIGFAQKGTTKKGTPMLQLVLDPRIGKLLPDHEWENEIYIFTTNHGITVNASMPDDYEFIPGKTKAEKAKEKK